MAKNRRNWLVNHIHDKALALALKDHAKGRMIDIGCGTKPYEKLAKPYVIEHVGVDREDPFNRNARVDVAAGAYEIPLGNDTFDTALSTAALEHLAEPEQALRECFRLLKPGGTAIYTVPFFWHIHMAPWDFYRFTRYGLEHVFKKAGFEIVDMKALSGFWVTFGQLFVYYLGRADKFRVVRWLRLVTLASLPIQGIAYLFDKLDRAEDWTWMYLIIARKPGVK